MQTASIHNIVALDVGSKRVGVAMTNNIARLPSPFTTLSRDETFWQKLELLLKEHDVKEVVVGLPRNLHGNDTEQTRATQQFISELNIRLSVVAATQDEALTSKRAEAELRARGKPYEKGDIDALAATFILEDYLNEQQS